MAKNPHLVDLGPGINAANNPNFHSYGPQSTNCLSQL